MTYEIEWNYSTNYSGKKVFSVRCNLKDHPSIESFFIVIEESDRSQNLKYDFSIRTITDRTGTQVPYYNHATTAAIQKQVFGNFAHLELDINDSSSPTLLVLLHATKESTLASTLVLFKLIKLNKEDEQKITNFLQTGIFTHKQLFEIILELIDQGKIQEAYDKANSSEKQGYKGMMFQVATVLAERNCTQPAYVSFSNVPVKDEKFAEAQIAAAKLAAQPQLPFANHKERLKAIFTHCQHAGPAGRPFIDNYFMTFTKLHDTKYKIEDIQTNFETLANMANVIALQNDEIQLLHKQLAELKNRRGSNYPFFNNDGPPNVDKNHQLEGTPNVDKNVDKNHQLEGPK